MSTAVRKRDLVPIADIHNSSLEAESTLVDNSHEHAFSLWGSPNYDEEEERDKYNGYQEDEGLGFGWSSDYDDFDDFDGSEDCGENEVDETEVETLGSPITEVRASR